MSSLKMKKMINIIVFWYYGNFVYCNTIVGRRKCMDFMQKSTQISLDDMESFFCNNEQSSGANAQGSLPQCLLTLQATSNKPYRK